MNKKFSPEDLQSELDKSNLNKTKRLAETSVEFSEKKKRFQIFKKLGLYAGLLGVAFSLNTGPVTAKNQEGSGRSFNKKNITEIENPTIESFDEIWSRVKEAFKYGDYYSQQEISHLIEKSTPIINETTQKVAQQSLDITQQALNEAEKIRRSSEEYFKKIDFSEILPSAKEVSIKESKEETPVPPKKPDMITPAVTRKLNEIEIQQASQKYDESKQETATPEAIIGPTNVPETPLAQIDIIQISKDPRQNNFSTFSEPYEYKGANDVMHKLGFTTFDIFYPDSYKLRNHEAVISYNELLPIFSEEVMAHSAIVVDEVNKFNQENPDLQLSPNLFLALMAIETNGANVESHMAAKGVLQVTTPVAEMYGYSGKQMFDPRINIRVGIKYFAQGYKDGLKFGLNKIDSLKYASMYYNGGPGNANSYFGFSSDGESEYVRDRSKVNSQKDVSEFLIKYLGSDRLKGKEYWTYGPRMTKVETLLYADSFMRLFSEQVFAMELKNKGLSDEEIRSQLKTPLYIKQLKKFIRLKQSGNLNYFEDKEKVYEVLNNLVIFGNDDPEIRSTEVTESQNTTAFDLIRF